MHIEFMCVVHYCGGDVRPFFAPHTEHDVVIRLIKGDTQAFQYVVSAAQSSLVQHALRYVRTYETAEEVVQDVMLWLWNHRTTLQPDRSLTGYLIRAVRNRAHDVRTRERRQRFTTLPESRRPWTPDEELIADDLLVALASVLYDLHDRPREVFLMSYLQDLSIGEIARQLGVSRNTARLHKISSRKIIRERLRALGFDVPRPRHADRRDSSPE